MPEMRFNLVTQDWVIIATERAKRPEDFIKKDSSRKEIPSYVETCPFCPGNEHMTPPETYVINGEKGWQVRVTPNKFAALSSEGSLERNIEGIKRSMSGVGIHEVIIESPLHNMGIALLPQNNVRDIIKAYKDRYNDIYNDPRVRMVIIFKNHGEAAGTSLEHPHSQIIGTPVTPGEIRHRVEESMRYLDVTGSCVFCDLLRDELKDGSRVIMNGEHFVSFIPYAALSIFHTWIFPKRHHASFGSITDGEISDLSNILKGTLSKIYHGLDNPDFNYAIRSLRDINGDIEYFHWYISIIPRVTRMAGFELGSGMFINTSLPEKSAEYLGNVKINS